LVSQNLTKQPTVSISIHSYDNNEVRSAGLGNLQIACLLEMQMGPFRSSKTEASPVNLGSLSQPPEAPTSATASPWNDVNETGAQLLELHTGAAVVYVCPSRWQRIRLQWAFRHFHELPLQVLSRRDQRLIE
jgi:hypothetical protein